mgnify:CR=1 FL=1
MNIQADQGFQVKEKANDDRASQSETKRLLLVLQQALRSVNSGGSIPWLGVKNFSGRMIGRRVRRGLSEANDEGVAPGSFSD